MAPGLTVEERVDYLGQEVERIREMLDGAEECKWIYQSLIELNLIHKDLAKQWLSEVRDIREWVDKLLELDPTRSGRWVGLKKVM